MQKLAHQGEEDMWFSGNPHHSLFLPVSTKNEVYVQTSFEVPFDGPTNFGESAVCTIPMYGDRITDMSFKVILPQLDIPIVDDSWVYPEAGITAPKIYTFFANQTYEEIVSNQTVPFYSTINLQWFPNTSNLTLSVSESNFVFTYSPSVAAIGFLRNDTIFFGFDLSNCIYQIPVQAQEYIYVFNTTPTSPLTFEQSGWIRGYLPSPLPVQYVDSVATYLIRSARFLIGGQTIDTVTGEYIEFTKDLDIVYENQAALTLLIGKNDESSIQIPRTYYVKLPFPSNIPIRDLLRQDVQVELEFETFYNITPYTIQSNEPGFLNKDRLVFFNYITGDNSAVPIVQGLPFNQVIGDTLYTLALVVDSIVWDGQYLYMFTNVTILEADANVPYFIIFDTHKDIVTDSSATTLSPFSDFVQNESITSIGTTLYAVGITGTIYSTTMRGPIPYTLVPTAISVKLPLLETPLFSKTVATTVTEQTDVSTLTIEFTDVFGVSVGLGVPLSTTVYGIVAGVTGNYVTFAFISSPQFYRTTASSTPSQTGVVFVVIEFTDITGITAGQLAKLTPTLIGQVYSIIGNYVTIAFSGATNTPALSQGVQIVFYRKVSVTPTIYSSTSLGFYYPVSTYTLGTDGLNLYITSTVNDSTAGPQYSNVFKVNTTTYASENLVPDATINVNFSVQPVFDGQNMWYVDKYQTSNIYTYNISNEIWTQYNYTTLLSVPQQNFSFSLYDGAHIYWFTDQTLTESLATGAPISAGTNYWIRYNINTDTWEAFDWFTNLYSPNMGLANGTTDPTIKEAVFDGRYINLSSSKSTIMFRYDTRGPFTSASSYEWINYVTRNSSNGNGTPNIINPYGYGATVGPMVYDGRFIFYLPYTSGLIEPSSNSTVPAFIYRFDTALPVNPQGFKSSMIVKYDKLPNGTKLPKEYFITQTSVTHTDKDVSRIDSAGPVKEIIVVNQTPTLAPKPYAYNTQAKDIRMFFNDESVFDYRSWIFEPFVCHAAIPQRNMSLITFSTMPSELEPSGTVNFSRIRDVRIEYPVTSNSYTRIYTKSYNILRINYGTAGLAFNSPQWQGMSSMVGRWTPEYTSQIFVG